MSVALELKIGFIAYVNFGDGSLRGGLLVTDDKTRPREFRATSPVKPTAMQRLLYAATYESYVYGDLIGLPLLNSAKEKISLLIATEKRLTDLRPKLGFPVAAISSPRQPSQSQANGLSNTIGFETHRSFASENEYIKQVMIGLEQQGINIAEPFERVKAALSEIHKQRPEDSRR